MADNAQFGIEMTGDASSLVAASQQAKTALDSTKIKLAELTPEQKQTCKAMQETGEAAKNPFPAYAGECAKLGV